MKNKLELVKFNLTHTMTKELIKFNEIKKELIELQSKTTLSKDELFKIQKLEKSLNQTRKKFINEFRDNNKEEIIKYLELKDHF